jgi:hypothetical protein
MSFIRTGSKKPSRFHSQPHLIPALTTDGIWLALGHLAGLVEQNPFIRRAHVARRDRMRQTRRMLRGAPLTCFDNAAPADGKAAAVAAEQPEESGFLIS